MRKRIRAPLEGDNLPIYLDDSDLAELIGIGKTGARKLANEAGAVRKIGKRRLNKVETVINYIEQINGEV